MDQLNRLPLSGLRAAEAIGRLGTLRAAADALGITPGAVSQRLQALETVTGRPLFIRGPQGMTPTELGVEMLPHLQAGFARLSDAAAVLRPDTCSLTISAAPLLASRWLIWRLSDFEAENPEIRIRIEPTDRIVDLRVEDVDLCLRIGRKPWPGLDCEQLHLYSYFPVCAPSLLPRLSSTADLAQVPLIRERDHLESWEAWLAAEGLALGDMQPGPDHGDAGLCLDAAMTGRGVAIAWDTIAADPLARGTLVRPFPRRVTTGLAIWLVGMPGTLSRTAPRRFAAWLRARLASERASWETA